MLRINTITSIRMIYTFFFFFARVPCTSGLNLVLLESSIKHRNDCTNSINGCLIAISQEKRLLGDLGTDERKKRSNPRVLRFSWRYWQRYVQMAVKYIYTRKMYLVVVAMMVEPWGRRQLLSEMVSSLITVSC